MGLPFPHLCHVQHPDQEAFLKQAANPPTKQEKKKNNHIFVKLLQISSY